MKKILLLFILLSSLSLLAQNNNKPNSQAGNLEITTGEQKKTYPYSENQEAVINYVKNILVKAKELNSGNISALPELNNYLALHLAATYLDCTLKRGSCPIFLVTLLESDIINSKISGTARCPNLKRFWKAWIENDMKKRVSLNVKTGMLGKTEQFNREELPKYIKCVDTIQEILTSSADSSAEFFKERYSPDRAEVKNLEITAKYLEYVKAKIPNIFAEVGLQNPK